MRCREKIVLILFTFTLSCVAGVVADPYRKLPLAFEANRGQADSRFSFLSRGSGYTLLLGAQESVLAAANDVLHMRILGGRTACRFEGLEPLAGHTNHFVGNDPTRWRAGLDAYGRVRAHDVYPGIDLVYYGQQGQLENDFVIGPGADPRAIRIAFEGAKDLRIDAGGDLVVSMATGAIRWRKPIIYQVGNNGRQTVAGKFVLRGNVATFDVAGYDPRRELIIDPVITFFTYFGGVGNDAGRAIAVDPAGNVYIAGSTTSINLPLTPTPGPAPFQSTYKGEGFYIVASGDAFVAKFDPAGKLVYCTYLGGVDDDIAMAVAADSSGNAYVTGITKSKDFPVTAASFNNAGRGFGGIGDSPFGGDAFVTKLNPTGDKLVYSTFLGGSQADSGWGIAVDSTGNAYVTGQTNSRNFPVMNPLQPTFGGTQQPTLIDPGLQPVISGDVFVAKLNAAGSALIYSTYLGGTKEEAGLAIAIDKTGAAYITGYTTSADFPKLKPYQSAYGESGGERNFTFGDAFVFKLAPAGNALVYSTYLGGSRDDIGYGIAVDDAGSAYVTGSTLSTDFPVLRGSFNVTYGGAGGDTNWSSGDCFVTKMKPDGSDRVYSTYLGGSLDDRCFGIAVDSAGNAYVAGNTLSATNFPTSADATQKTYGGSGGPAFTTWGDAFVSKLDPAGAKLIFSTYIGGANDDVALGIALDSTNSVYVAGNTVSVSIPNPTTAGTFTRRYNGFAGDIAGFFLGDAFWVKFADPVTPPPPPPPTPPSFTADGVVNAISFLGGPVAPGETINLTVKNAGPDVPVTQQPGPDGNIATTLGDSRVYFDNVPAPMLSATAGKLSAIVPFGVAGKTTTQVQVEYKTIKSAAVVLAVADTAPALYILDGSGSGQGFILNEDGTLNAPANPASIGSVVTFFLNGTGLLNPPQPDGSIVNYDSPDNAPLPAQVLSVTIDGQPADIQQAVAIVGQPAGQLLVNVTVPDAASTGDAIAVVVTAGTRNSQDGVTLALQPAPDDSSSSLKRQRPAAKRH